MRVETKMKAERILLQPPPLFLGRISKTEQRFLQFSIYKVMLVYCHMMSKHFEPMRNTHFFADNPFLSLVGGKQHRWQVERPQSDQPGRGHQLFLTVHQHPQVKLLPGRGLINDCFTPLCWKTIFSWILKVLSILFFVIFSVVQRPPQTKHKTPGPSLSLDRICLSEYW